jgi:putative NADH-flavin reductase
LTTLAQDNQSRDLADLVELVKRGFEQLLAERDESKAQINRLTAEWQASKEADAKDKAAKDNSIKELQESLAALRATVADQGKALKKQNQSMTVVVTDVTDHTKNLQIQGSTLLAVERESKQLRKFVTELGEKWAEKAYLLDELDHAKVSLKFP